VLYSEFRLPIAFPNQNFITAPEVLYFETKAPISTLEVLYPGVSKGTMLQSQRKKYNLRGAPLRFKLPITIVEVLYLKIKVQLQFQMCSLLKSDYPSQP
jgi:hypothetical protein